MCKCTDSIQIDLSLQKTTGDFWVDYGTMILNSYFGDGPVNFNKILDWLNNKLVEETGNKGYYYDEKSDALKEYDKVTWRRPLDGFISVVDNKSKVIPLEKLPEHIVRELELKQVDSLGEEDTIEQTEEETNKNSKKSSKKRTNRKKSFSKKIEVRNKIPEYKIKINFDKNDVCSVCGSSSCVTETKKYMHPFAVDREKFLNFYSYGKQPQYMCPRCALSGIAAYLGAVWSKSPISQNDYALHLFVFQTKPEDLLKFYKDVLPSILVNNKNQFKNGYRYLHESLFSFILTLFKYIEDSYSEPSVLVSILREIMGVNNNETDKIMNIHVISGVKDKTLNIERSYNFSNLSYIYKIYQKWLETLGKLGVSNRHETILHILNQFSLDGNDYYDSFREQFCEEILNLGDPLPVLVKFMNDFVLKNKIKEGLKHGTLDIVMDYVASKYNIDTKIQKMLITLGKKIGEMIVERGRDEILIEMKNCSTINQFLNNLINVQSKLELKIPLDLLEVLNVYDLYSQGNDMWDKFKNILYLYTANTYIRKKYKKYGDTKQI